MVRNPSQSLAIEIRPQNLRNGWSRQPRRLSQAGFSLLELLVVITIILILTPLAIMALQGGLDSGNLNSSVNQISGTFEQARAYALANNTYVLVGITEVDGSAAGVNFNVPLTSGVGRIVVETVATQDGTNGLVGNLTPISKPLILGGLHLVDLSGINSGNMTRTAVNTSPADLTLSGFTPISTPPTSWPYGGSFNGVFVQFDPRGTAVPVTSLAGDTIITPSLVPLMEVGVQIAHGNAVPAQTGGLSSNKGYSAIQIEGVSGSITTYRP